MRGAVNNDSVLARPLDDRRPDTASTWGIEKDYRSGEQCRTDTCLSDVSCKAVRAVGVLPGFALNEDYGESVIGRL